MIYIINNTDSLFNHKISLHGDFDKIEFWNLYTGMIHLVKSVERGERTIVDLNIPSVRSVFIVAKKKSMRRTI